MNKLYNLSVLLLVFGTAYGQDIDSSAVEYSFHQHLSIDKKIVVTGEGGFMTSFLNNTLVKENYWTDEIIQNQINNLGDANRFGAYGDFNAAYHSGKGLIYGAGYLNIVGGLLQKQLLQIALEGNQSQPIITLENNNGLEQLGLGYISIGKEKIDSAKSTRMFYSLKLYSRQQYSKVSATSGKFELDSAGESINVSDANVAVTQGLSDPFTSFGLGIGFGFEKPYRDGLITFSFDNLGLLLGRQTRSAQMHSNFVFDGFDLSSQINQAGAIAIQDSLNNQFFDVDTSSAVQLLPMIFQLGYDKPLGNQNLLHVELRHLYFTGYYPLVKAEYHQKFKGKSAAWNIGTRIGGFGNYGLSFGAKLPINNKHQFTIQVAGVESMVSSNLPVNWYGRFGLSIQL